MSLQTHDWHSCVLSCRQNTAATVILWLKTAHPGMGRGFGKGWHFGENPPSGSPQNSSTLHCLEAARPGICPCWGLLLPHQPPQPSFSVLDVSVPADCSGYREIPQNLRLLWVGTDIKAHLVPYPAMGRVTFHWTSHIHSSPEHFQGVSEGFSLFCCALLGERKSAWWNGDSGIWSHFSSLFHDLKGPCIWRRNTGKGEGILVMPFPWS